MNFLTDTHVANFRQQELWLIQKWQQSLNGQGVEWPNSAVQRAQLVGLSFFLGLPVDKDSLGKFVQAVAGGGLDSQARHLRPKGWSVVGGGRGDPETNHLPDGTRMPRNAYALLSVTSPSTVFSRSQRLKRGGRVAAVDWRDICVLYEGKCAHCGRETPNPDKGHMDPNKGLSIQNLIPLCVSCNNWAMDDVIFEESGRIKTILSERFLRGAPVEALRRIQVWLNAELGGQSEQSSRTNER